MGDTETPLECEEEVLLLLVGLQSGDHRQGSLALPQMRKRESLRSKYGFFLSVEHPCKFSRETNPSSH